MNLLTAEEHRISELLLTHKLSSSSFSAAHIVRGCQLVDMDTDEARLARARLYRDWRTAKVFGDKTAPCFAAAVRGEAVPQETFLGKTRLLNALDK